MARRNGTGQIKPCAGCGRLMRPARWSAKDYPGTLIHTGNSLCGRCRSQGVQGVTHEKKIPGRASLEENKRSLDAFLNRISADHQKLERRKKVRMVIR